MKYSLNFAMLKKKKAKTPPYEKAYFDYLGFVFCV